MRAAYHGLQRPPRTATPERGGVQQEHAGGVARPGNKPVRHLNGRTLLGADEDKPVFNEVNEIESPAPR